MYTVEIVLKDTSTLEFTHITKIVYYTASKTVVVEEDDILSHSFYPHYRYSLYGNDSVFGVGASDFLAIKIFKEK